MFLMYHSDEYNTSATMFHWCTSMTCIVPPVHTHVRTYLAYVPRLSGSSILLLLFWLGDDKSKRTYGGRDRALALGTCVSFSLFEK
jgi:hypothetical protein